MNQYLAKQMLGDNAVHTIGKLYMGDKGEQGDFKMVMVGGVLLFPKDVFPLEVEKVKSCGQWFKEEMWEAEVYIVPRRRYRGFKEIQGGSHLRIDQILVGGYENPDRWDKKVFEVNE